MSSQERFNGEWETKRLGDLLSYKRPDPYIVQSTEYIEHGDIPVLTANKAFILGYIDETFGICQNIPVIVFDDFTTDNKYASFPFKVKSSAIKLLYPKHKGVNLRFVFERMQLIDYPLGNHKRYYISEYQNLELPVPDYEEQRAIVEVLSDVDGLINALDALIAKKRAIKQATMQQLLTGKTRLPGFSRDWETKRLGELGTFSKGRGIKRDDVSDDGLPCIRYGELYTRYQDYILDVFSRIPQGVAETALPIKKGNLLFAGSGETAEEIGRCAAYLGEEQAYAGGDVIVFTPSEQNSIYLGHLMNSTRVAAQKARLGQGDAVVHIYINNLAQVQIDLPSLDEQRAIATVLSDMDTEIAALEYRRDKTIAIKQGMMQQLLTGKVRLLKSNAM